jgi:multisubunit Na+/H+ antiporter MnhE subunit
MAWWVALAVVWLLLVDTFQPDELVVGAAAASMAATVGTVVQHRGYIRFRPRAAWILETPYLIGGIVVDTGLLAAALWRRLVLRQPVRGETIRVPFHHGEDTGRDGARRALVNFAVSITPNSYVVDIDPEGDSLLVHRLVPVPLDRVLRREELRARTISPISDQAGFPTSDQAGFPTSDQGGNP